MATINSVIGFDPSALYPNLVKEVKIIGKKLVGYNSITGEKTYHLYDELSGGFITVTYVEPVKNN